MLGFAMGPFLGGLITHYLSWGWIFLVNLPIGIAALIAGYYFISQYKVDDLPLFDIPGFILAASSLLLITFFIEMLNHYELVAANLVYLAGMSGTLLFAILAYYSFKAPRPILDFKLLHVSTFRIGFIINICMYAFNTSTTFLLPLMYQEGFGLDPLKSGLLTVPIAIGSVALRAIAPKIIKNLGFRGSLISALSLTLIFLGGLTIIDHNTSYWYICLVEFGLGGATVLVASSTGALNYVDIAQNAVSQATAIDLTFRQFASGIGIGLTSYTLSILVSHSGLIMHDPEGSIYHYTFFVMGSLVILGLAASCWLSRNAGHQALEK